MCVYMWVSVSVLLCKFVCVCVCVCLWVCVYVCVCFSVVCEYAREPHSQVSVRVDVPFASCTFLFFSGIHVFNKNYVVEWLVSRALSQELDYGNLFFSNIDSHKLSSTSD